MLLNNFFVVSFRSSFLVLLKRTGEQRNHSIFLHNKTYFYKKGPLQMTPNISEILSKQKKDFNEHSLSTTDRMNIPLLKPIILSDYQIACLTVSRDGEIVVSGSYDSIIRVWSLKTSKCLKELSGHTGPINAVDLGLNGETLVSGAGG